MYTITHPQILAIHVNTWPEVFYALNEREAGENFFVLRQTGPIEVIDLQGTVYPVNLSSGELAPSFAPFGNIGAAEVLTQILHADKHHLRHANGTPKKPYQVTTAVWRGLQQIMRASCGIGECFTPEQMRIESCVNGKLLRAGLACQEIFTSTFGFNDNWNVDEDYEQHYGDHRHIVALALLKGTDVPEEVIRDCRNIDFEGHRARGLHHLKWLLENPVLRGKFKSLKHLGFLQTQVGKPDCTVREVTIENVGHLASLFNGLPKDALHNDMDNMLFDAGILLPRVAPERQAPAPEHATAINDFAQLIYDKLVAQQKKDMQERLDEQKRNMSKRDVIAAQQRIDSPLSDHSYAYPNQMAQAVLDKNIHRLVEVLDSTLNTSTQRAVKEHFGIQIERLSSEKRVRAIFELVGYVSDEDYRAARATYEAQVQAAKDAKLALQKSEDEKKRMPRAKAQAERQRFQFQDRIVNGAQFVEAVIAQGYTQLKDHARGAAKVYRLHNPDLMTGGYEVNLKDGTLEYARCLLEAAEITGDTSTT